MERRDRLPLGAWDGREAGGVLAPALRAAEEGCSLTGQPLLLAVLGWAWPQAHMFQPIPRTPCMEDTRFFLGS